MAIGAHSQASGSTRVGCISQLGLQQEERTRIIDNMRPVNQTVTAFKSPRPHTVDVLGGMGKELMPQCSDTGKSFRPYCGLPPTAVAPAYSLIKSFISIWDCGRKAAIFRFKDSKPTQLLEDFSLLVLGLQGDIHSLDPVLR